jgi:hypothetical protein
MGMDIHARRRIGQTLHYNWNGWSTLIGYLEKWDVDVSEFSEFNDGDLIKPKTCRIVADALLAHWSDVKPQDREWLRGHSYRWQKMAEQGGAEQW